MFSRDTPPEQDSLLLTKGYLKWKREKKERAIVHFITPGISKMQH